MEARVNLVAIKPITNDIKNPNIKKNIEKLTVNKIQKRKRNVTNTNTSLLCTLPI
jgi:hypothetical protein